MLKPSSELNKVVDDLSQGLWSLKYLLVVSAGLCALQSLVPALCPFVSLCSRRRLGVLRRGTAEFSQPAKLTLRE